VKLLKEAMLKIDLSKKIGMVLNKSIIGEKDKHKYYKYYKHQ